jgi:hypothetical protein
MADSEDEEVQSGTKINTLGTASLRKSLRVLHPLGEVFPSREQCFVEGAASHVWQRLREVPPQGVPLKGTVFR